MLKIGQIRKDNYSSPYLTDLSFTPTIVRNAGYEGSDIVFQDFAIQLTSGAFKAQVSYYIRVSIKRYPYEPDEGKKAYGDPTLVNFSLTLYETQGSSEGKHEQEKQQIVEKNLELAPYIDGYNDEWQAYTFVFTPNEDYNYLCFKITRIGYDYVNRDTPRIPFVYTAPGASDNTMDFETNGDLCQVNNILPRIMNKIGIQSRPGTMFVVNREPIVLGRSGIYEVNNGTKISSVGVVAPNGSSSVNIQDFLLDYGYELSDDE